jgi:hypothetical protein
MAKRLKKAQKHNKQKEENCTMWVGWWVGWGGVVGGVGGAGGEAEGGRGTKREEGGRREWMWD